MLTFGTVAFTVTEAAYQALRRASRYRLPAHERIGGQVAYQFTGRGEDSITLSGTIMATYRGRIGVLDDLRALGAAGEARLLTSGAGESFGRWALEEVSEERTALFADGAPRKVTFSVRLKHDEDTPAGRTAQLEAAAAETGDVNAVLDAMSAAVADGEDSAGVIAAARGAA